MDAETVAVLSVALAAIFVVVVVGIAMEDQVSARARVDEQSRPETMVQLEQLESIVAGVLGTQQGIRMVTASAHLGIADFQAPKMHPASGHENDGHVDRGIAGDVFGGIEHGRLAGIGPNLGATAV